MNLLILVGLQASGKSTYVREHFYDTHLRINLDMLRTRHREKLLFGACLKAKQPVVVDNTNLTVEARRRYLQAALAQGFTAEAYFFVPDLAACLQRNQGRSPKKQVPELALRGAAKKLIPPRLDEGFSALYQVELGPQGFTTQLLKVTNDV